MILFNNETMILPSSQARSKNISQLENSSPRKTGRVSARQKKVRSRRDQIDPVDLINMLDEKSVEAIDKSI